MSTQRDSMLALASNIDSTLRHFPFSLFGFYFSSTAQSEIVCKYWKRKPRGNESGKKKIRLFLSPRDFHVRIVRRKSIFSALIFHLETVSRHLMSFAQNIFRLLKRKGKKIIMAKIDNRVVHPHNAHTSTPKYFAFRKLHSNLTRTEISRSNSHSFTVYEQLKCLNRAKPCHSSSCSIFHSSFLIAIRFN